MAFKVHVTRPIPESAYRVLREADCLISVPDDPGLPSRSSLLEAVREVDGLLSILTERIDGDLMDLAPNLRVVSNMAVGFDNIEVPEATRRGIAVCNTPSVLTETSADFAFALLMAVARRVVEADTFVRQGRFQWWGPKLLMGGDIYGQTLGIIGFGKIGRAVAKRAQGFGMRVLYSGDSAPEESSLGEKVSQEKLLRESDFVSLHVPYRPSTHHLIGAEELKRMKGGAYLINTARGPVVNEAELVSALREGHIAGAGLDVFEEEPRVHEGLMELPNVVLAPHIASASQATRALMARMAAENLVACLRGESPHSIVNPEVLHAIP